MAAGDKVFLADKVTLDTVNRNVSDIHSRVGTTTDTGGTATAGTLFGKLNTILAAWTAARAAKIDNIDTNATSAASNAAAASAQTAANHTANATGTLSQKLSHVISILAGVNTTVISSNKRLVAKKVTSNIPSGASATVINVAGPGVLYGGTISHNSISAPTVVTIDGVAYTVANNSGGAFARVLGSASMFSNITSGNTVIPAEFKTSLKVDVRAAGDANVFCYVDYSLYE